jgi:hypothetical protein
MCERGYIVIFGCFPRHPDYHTIWYKLFQGDSRDHSKAKFLHNGHVRFPLSYLDQTALQYVVTDIVRNAPVVLVGVDECRDATFMQDVKVILYKPGTLKLSNEQKNGV